MVFSNVTISLVDIIQLGSILLGLGALFAEVKHLSKRVEKHNNVIERVYKLEENVGTIDIGALKQEVTDLNSQVKTMRECKNVCLKNHQIS